MKGEYMEKKLKIADFAALVGVTPKTVYKMVERNELVTVSEKVNNRTTTLVVTNDDQIEEFKVNYGKTLANGGNCEDILTGDDARVNVNDASQIRQNNDFALEMLDKVMKMNQEYNDRIEKLNNELMTTKAQTLLLEDKASREGLYLNEINELKKDNNELKSVNKRVMYISVTVIVILSMVILGNFIFNNSNSEKKEHAQQEIVQIK